MTLRFEDRYYRLAGAQGPERPRERPGRIASLAWPEGEIFRRLVDYEQDLAARQEAASKTLTDRLSRWLGRRE